MKPKHRASLTTSTFLATITLAASLLLASNAQAQSFVIYTYDALGRVITATYADGTTTTYSKRRADAIRHLSHHASFLSPVPSSEMSPSTQLTG